MKVTLIAASSLIFAGSAHPQERFVNGEVTGVVLGSSGLDDLTAFEGFPLTETISLSFTGNQDFSMEIGGILTIESDESKLDIAARTPSTLVLGPQHKVFALNFGSGSGQVFDLEVFRLDGSQIELSDFDSEMVSYAARHACPISPALIDIRLESWDSPNRLGVRTSSWKRVNKDDWTQRDVDKAHLCNEALNRTWTITLPE